MNDNRSHFEKINALSSSVIGFEFEFYTNMLKGQAAEALSKLTNKKVHVSEEYHSSLELDRNNFKLEPDYSGGSNMMEFITGPLPYNEAIPILIKVLNWIEENGWTSDRSAFQFSVSFDKFRKDVKDRIESLDKLKFILGFNENYIYSKFGNRTKSVYAKSIKRIVPVNRFSMVENITSIDSKMYKIPNEKYYGVNFTKIPLGYIEFRYLGNRDYEKKTKDIREIIDYCILYLYDMLSHRINDYTSDDLKKLNEILSKYAKVSRAFSNPDFFFQHFPDFHISIDLKNIDENIKTYWASIRDKIFDIIVEGNVTSGYYNYDTTNGRHQLKDARSREAFGLIDIDLISCDIKNAIIKNCNIHSCNIKKSSMENSVIFNGNTIISSKVKDCTVNTGNQLNDCFIDCEGKNINCEVIGGVLRAGNIGEYAEISKETLRVKSFQDFRKQRFVTNKSLKDLNDKYHKSKFKDMNY